MTEKDAVTEPENKNWMVQGIPGALSSHGL